jgi:hypothetical protein
MGWISVLRLVEIGYEVGLAGDWMSGGSDASGFDCLDVDTWLFPCFVTQIGYSTIGRILSAPLKNRFLHKLIYSRVVVTTIKFQEKADSKIMTLRFRLSPLIRSYPNCPKGSMPIMLTISIQILLHHSLQLCTSHEYHFHPEITLHRQLILQHLNSIPQNLKPHLPSPHSSPPSHSPHSPPFPLPEQVSKTSI